MSVGPVWGKAQRQRETKRLGGSEEYLVIGQRMREEPTVEGVERQRRGS